MKVQLCTELPKEWKSKKPIHSYETRILYTGFRRYDTERKVVSEILYSDNGVIYNEYPMEEIVLSRSYTTEHVRITVYSESPRVWVEELSPEETFVFVEK